MGLWVGKVRVEAEGFVSGFVLHRELLFQKLIIRKKNTKKTRNILNKD